MRSSRGRKEGKKEGRKGGRKEGRKAKARKVIGKNNKIWKGGLKGKNRFGKKIKYCRWIKGMISSIVARTHGRTHLWIRSRLICIWESETLIFSARQMVRSNLWAFCTYVLCDLTGKHLARLLVSLSRSWVISNFDKSFWAVLIILSSSAHSVASLIASDRL